MVDPALVVPNPMSEESATRKLLFTSSVSLALTYVSAAFAPSIVIPAPSAAAALAAPSARTMFLSSTVSVAVLRVTVVPLTVRFPVTTRFPSNVSSTLERKNAVESRLSRVSALPPVETTPVTPSFAST